MHKSWLHIESKEVQTEAERDKDNVWKLIAVDSQKVKELQWPQTLNKQVKAWVYFFVWNQEA